MIVAGPFLGELGWEVSLWAPWLRWNRKENDLTRNLEMAVVCQAGHEHLYEDFADKVYSMEMKRRPLKVDCQLAWLPNGRPDRIGYMKMAKDSMGNDPVKILKSHYLGPTDMPVSWVGSHPPTVNRANYVPYGSDDKQDGWIAVHARHLPDRNGERDWPLPRFDSLLEGLDTKHVLCIGSRWGSSALAAAEDLRGLPLKETCHAISKCKMIIGPSSGPMALALLCKTPVVWWSPNQKDAARFAAAWNPFETPQIRAAVSWRPSVERVLEACLRFS